jgi:glutamate N-acetyltransferase/amino-acid N-acetyltransferase
MPITEEAAAIVWPAGFHFAAGHCGIKSQAADLGLAWSDSPAACAALFTTNRVQAAPVRLSRLHLASRHGRMRAMVVNSGNANCATGRAGERAALSCAAAAGRALGCAAEEVLVCSTGVIGVPLDARLIARALPAWARREDGPLALARAILTTDTRMKVAGGTFRDGAGAFRIAGMAKGSGMIHPRMATMLAFVFTDAPLPPASLRAQLRAAAAESFNRISVDGDTSTNDTLALFASGAGAPLSAAGQRGFAQTLAAVCRSLALQIVRDGEGARRLVRIQVRGARTLADADRAARAIANSPLVKTALAGADPNWGRVLAAAGYSGARFDPELAEVRFNRLLVYKAGRALPFDEASAKRDLDRPELEVGVDLKAGRAQSWMWTCDLTEGYIKINASYRS